MHSAGKQLTADLICRVPADGEGVVTALSGSLAVTGVAWLPGADALLTTSAGGAVAAWQLALDGTELQPVPHLVEAGSRSRGVGAAMGVAMSPSGAFAAVARAGRPQLESNKCAVVLHELLPSVCHPTAQCLNLIATRWASFATTSAPEFAGHAISCHEQR